MSEHISLLKKYFDENKVKFSGEKGYFNGDQDYFKEVKISKLTGGD